MTATPGDLSARLLACPFCGGEPERIDFGPGSGDNEGGSCIACTKCQASGPVEFGYKENFVANWNRRAALSALPAGGERDDPIDANDNADYIEHCAAKLTRLGYRITGQALSCIAAEHRQLASALPAEWKEDFKRGWNGVFTSATPPADADAGAQGEE